MTCSEPYLVSLEEHQDHLKKWILVRLFSPHKYSFTCIHTSIKGPDRNGKQNLQTKQCRCEYIHKKDERQISHVAKKWYVVHVQPAQVSLTIIIINTDTGGKHFHFHSVYWLPFTYIILGRRYISWKWDWICNSFKLQQQIYLQYTKNIYIYIIGNGHTKREIFCIRWHFYVMHHYK